MALQQTPVPQLVAQQVAQQITPWIPVATFVIGQLFAIGLEWLRGKATATREREARAQSRKEAVEDRRAEFQRQTLLQLQDELQEFARIGGRIWSERERVSKERGAWEPALADELNVQTREAYARMNIFQSRVLDERLRELVEQVKQRQLAHVFAKSKATGDEEFHAMGDAFEDANRRVGELLRALY